MAWKIQTTSINREEESITISVEASSDDYLRMKTWHAECAGQTFDKTTTSLSWSFRVENLAPGTSYDYVVIGTNSRNESRMIGGSVSTRSVKLGKIVYPGGETREISSIWLVENGKKTKVIKIGEQDVE